MIYFAIALLWSWIPIVLFMFASMPPRRAAIVSSVTAWLLLPGLAFNLPGLPDYTKTTATVWGVLMGMVIFDHGRLLALRPRWFDIPVVVWCTSVFVTALTNQLGPYDGLSMVVRQTFRWGLPYLIGRVYLADCEGLRDLARAIIIGALLYIPPCLWEIRMSPHLSQQIYGVITWGWEGQRYGGYRPRVFMYTGLELGMWMTAASLSGYWLWATGALRQLRGFSFGTLLCGLFAITILCKSTGAILLLGIGIATYWALAKFRWTWPIWVLLATPPTYEIVRGAGLWSGQSAVELSRSIFGKERSDSLATRIWNEDILVAKALQRPLFGWGEYGRARVYDANGKDISITDGYWVLALGNYGLVNLAAMNATLLLPLYLLVRRIPPRHWTDPRISPVAVMALLLALYMLDNLSNAMVNPIYALAIGGVTGFRPPRPRRGRDQDEVAKQAEARIAPGHRRDRVRARTAPAAPDATRRARVVDPDQRQAERLRARAGQLAATGRSEAAIALYRRAAGELEGLVALRPDDPSRRDALAWTYADLGRLLADGGRPGEAKPAWTRAEELLAGLAAASPEDLALRERWLDHLNDLGWLLANDPGDAGDPTIAVALVSTAVSEAPDRPTYWNTLGVARYRCGDYAGAVEAIRKAVDLAPEGTSFDHFYLALAHARIGDPAEARAWYARGVAWMERNRPRHEVLRRLREEAASVLDDLDQPGPRAADDRPRRRLALPDTRPTETRGRPRLPGR